MTLERYPGAQLLPGRCGVCYKCCWEYLACAPALDKAYSLYCLDRIHASWASCYNTTPPATRPGVLTVVLDGAYRADLQAWAKAYPTLNSKG